MIELKSELNKSRFKNILILDCDIVQSKEAAANDFNKLVIFYILCVSHVVLICNKDEINKNMEETLKLAIDCMGAVHASVGGVRQINIIIENASINEKF